MMWRLLNKVYALPSIVGKRRWVDYVPVKVGTYSGRQDSYDDLGSVKAEVLTSASGLVAWSDYTPVYEVTDGVEGRWRTGEAGWIPVTDTSGGSGGGSSFTVLDSDANSFSPTFSVLDSDGNSFTVSSAVLNSGGSSFSPI